MNRCAAATAGDGRFRRAGAARLRSVTRASHVVGSGPMPGISRGRYDPARSTPRRRSHLVGGGEDLATWAVAQAGAIRSPGLILPTAWALVRPLTHAGTALDVERTSPGCGRPQVRARPRSFCEEEVARPAAEIWPGRSLQRTASAYEEVAYCWSAASGSDRVSSSARISRSG
jgi:hypothetical protein